MVDTPTITDITSLLYNTDTGTGEHVHKYTNTQSQIRPIYSVLLPKQNHMNHNINNNKNINKNIRPRGHTAKTCPTLQNGAVAKEQPHLQK